MTPMQAIKAKCTECSESAREVKNCPVKDCALYPFRLGRNPNIQRSYTEEQKQAMRDRLAAARDIKTAKT